MHDIIVGGFVLAGGLVLQANSQWFSGADAVGLVLVVVGAIVMAFGVLRAL